jgi:dTDP-4-dehydrorhamnose 3,5-epimerase
MLHGAVKDRATATPGGEVLQALLPGVALHPVRNIVTRNGLTTEIFSKPWEFLNGEVAHAIHASLNAQAISAWHMHEKQTDHVYPIDGPFEVVIYDDRADSITRGRINVVRLSRYRPEILRIGPGLWHGIKNLSDSTASFINYFDQPYCHDDPDEWRLPFDTDRIPYRF